MSSYLDFRKAVDEQSTSWDRADPTQALIEKSSSTKYTVTLPGGSAHECHYGTERGGRVGYCDCKGWEFRDDDSTPCAHLCVLRKAEFIGSTTINGQPVDPEPTISEVEAGAVEPEPDILADGSGNPNDYAAGADGQQFGRPEGQL